MYTGKTLLAVQFSTSYHHVACAQAWRAFGGSPICAATCWKLSRFEMKVRRAACVVNFTQKSKAKGDDDSSIESDMYLQAKNCIQPGFLREIFQVITSIVKDKVFV